MNAHHDLPAEDTVRALLQAIAPGSTLVAVRPLAGSYSNYTHLVELDPPQGKRTRIVIRRYAESGGDRAQKARLEYQTLAWLQKHDVPVPRPLYLDETGALLGSPGIVTGYVPGKQVLSPADPRRWARALAHMLARIHSLPVEEARGFLLDANSEVVWFLHRGIVPDYMEAHPDGAALWQAVHDRQPHLQPVPPTLVHIDYWPGNILWVRGRISAVVDWEEAACGDPGIDVAYCRMEMILGGLGQAAAEFLHAYEAERGPVANLDFWALAAAVRPMIDPESWRLTDPAVNERLRGLIASALRR